MTGHLASSLIRTQNPAHSGSFARGSVVSHLIPEVHVHLIAAVPNGQIVEYMPWTAGLFENPPMPSRGIMKLPAGAGFGLSFNRRINDEF